MTLVRKTNNGVYLEGKEKDIRKAILNLLLLIKVILNLKKYYSRNLMNANIPHQQKIFKELFNYDFEKLSQITLHTLQVEKVTLVMSII